MYKRQDEAFPRVLFSRTMKKDKCRYFGPYTSAGAVKDTIDLIHKLWKLRTCTRRLPQDIGTVSYTHLDVYKRQLTDEEDIPEGIQKLRAVYPNLMRLEYDNRRTREDREMEAGDHEKEKTPMELFEEFYELQNNQPMNHEQKELAEYMIQKILSGEAGA